MGSSVFSWGLDFVPQANQSLDTATPGRSLSLGLGSSLLLSSFLGQILGCESSADNTSPKSEGMSTSMPGEMGDGDLSATP